MQTYLIYFLCFLLAAGGLFSSCTSGAPDDEPTSQSAELQFATAEPSRSPAVSTLNYSGAEFSIYGDMKLGGAASSAKNVVIFNGIPVTYNDSKWTYTNTQYWFPGHEHSFVAVYPATPTGASNTSYVDNSLSFDFALPASYADTPDLLFATHRRMYDTGATQAVVLRFNHALSRVNFVVKCDGAGEKVIVNEVKLKGLGKSATLAVTPASLTTGKQTDDYDLSWSGTQNNETLTAGIEVEIADGNELPLFPDTNALFVIPQPDNKGIALEISYTVYFTNGKSEDRTVAAESSIGGWEPGKVYTYSLAFTADDEPIKINVSVNDWKVGSTDNVSVPRK